MNVVQNYLVTIMHGDFSLYEVRILCHIIYHANKCLKGQRVSSLIGQRLSTDGISTVISLPIKTIASPTAHDYQAVFDAAVRLQDKVVEYYDHDTSSWTYYRSHLIDTVKWKHGSGIITFTVSNWLLQYILDFVHGNFSLYDFEQCLSLTSPYDVRMYWLTCSMKKPVKYRITMLKEMLGAETKYKQNRDFIKRCIESPMHHLEEKKLNGYTYHVDGRGKACTIEFFPVKRQEVTKQQTAAMLPASSWIQVDLRNYLLSTGWMTNEVINKNKTTLFDFGTLPNYQSRISRIVQNARKKDAGYGYIINAMKSEVAEFKARKERINASILHYEEVQTKTLRL